LSNNLSINKEGMLFCQENSLEETLVKISVEMFTKYYEMKFTTMTQMGFPYRCRIVSHFKALYYYRTGDYVKLLNTCDSIISNEIFVFFPEDRKHPKFLPGCRVQNELCVSIRLAFQTLFRNDVICLTGLIELNSPVVLDKEIADKRDECELVILKLSG